MAASLGKHNIGILSIFLSRSLADPFLCAHRRTPTHGAILLTPHPIIYRAFLLRRLLKRYDAFGSRCYASVSFFLLGRDPLGHVDQVIGDGNEGGYDGAKLYKYRFQCPRHHL